jgi:hypothetical protein
MRPLRERRGALYRLLRGDTADLEEINKPVVDYVKHPMD